MNILIVYAHEEPRSFNAAMKNVAIRTFEELGHTVVVSDLYRMKFKAVADANDFLERRDRHTLKRQQEELASVQLGTLATDILEEQRKLRACDLLILQFPMWWFSMPAILKGWIDRVLTMGFAYGGGRWYDQGGLQGKRALLSFTTGGPEGLYTPTGINGEMDRILFPIQHGILFFCGLEVLPPFIAHGIARKEDLERGAVLEAYRQHLLGLDQMSPLPFHPIAHYDQMLQLKPEHQQG